MTRTILDLAKPKTTVFDLSNVLNPRVNDDLSKISFHIQYDNKPFNMTGYKMYFISADENMGYINIDGMVDKIEIGDNVGNGDVTFKFPPNAFKKAGTFDSTKTMFVVENVNSNYIQSTVNISLTVLENGVAKFNADVDQIGYDSKLEQIHEQYKNKVQELLDELISQAQASNNFNDVKETANQAKQVSNDSIAKANAVNNEVTTARSRFSNLNDRLNNQDIKIDSAETVVNANENYLRLDLKNQQQDIVISTKADKDELENKLSQMKLYPEAFENADAIKQAYPNGKDGIFVAVDTGHQWYWINGAWKDGGSYQAPKDKEVEDARAWSVQLGTNDKYLNLTDSLVSLYLKTVDDLRKERKQRKSVESSIKSYIDSLPKITYGKQETFNIVDKDGLPIGSDIDTLTEIINTFDFGKINDDYHKTMNLKSIFTPDFRYWSAMPVLELNEVSQDVLDFNATRGIECKNVKYRFLKKGLGGILKSIKVQGSSSVNFPKKNYTLKFNEPVTLHDDWGSHTKYVIKSNFNDASQIRNLLSSKLWGSIIRTRLSDTIEPINVGDDILADNNGNTLVGSSDRIMSIGKNYGAIDGYPIVVVINGVFHGLYTLNIPKDDWMADMGNGKKEAIISADDDHSSSTYFRNKPTLDGDFEIEYVGKDDSWIKASLTNAINAVIGHYDNDDDYYTNINKYIDVDSAIDYFILCALIDNTDGIGKNYLLDTYDGTKWYFNAYDMDCVIGVFRTWNGTSVNWRESNKFENYASRHRMFYVIYNHMRDRFINRYEYLRKNALSFEKLYNLTMDLYGSIPQFLFDEDHKKWMLTPTTSIRTADQIIFWLDKQLQKLDTEITELKGEK